MKSESDFLQDIIEDCGLLVNRYEQVHGGDINKAYCIYTNSERFFLKVNDAASYPHMFEREAAGLTELKKHRVLTVPTVIKFGIAGNKEYLLLEWIEKGNPAPDFWEQFGSGLAELHRKEQPYFGWHHSNYIGKIPQCNTKHDTWDEFYASCRIMPMVEALFNKGRFTKEDIVAAGKFCNRLDELFPVEPPSLLHGDLWSRNFIVANNGQVAIFDPSVYYGHREMDLGMAQLFGGFDQRFFDAYHETFPLEHGWEDRIKLTEAYPLLAHAAMFGGIYISKARDVLHYFNNWT